MSTTSKVPQTRLQGRKMAGRPMSQTDEIPKGFAYLSVGTSILIVGTITFAFFKFHKSIVHLPKMATTADRLVYTLQLQAYSMIPLMICVFNVIANRILYGAINPLSGNEVVVDKSQRILTNTLEQSVLNLFSLIVLATLIPAEYMFVMVYLSGLFVLGRILFFIGYSIHPKFRTLGFLMTMTSTMVAIIANIAIASGLSRMMHATAATSGGGGSKAEL